jgi:hypothetical protein
VRKAEKYRGRGAKMTQGRPLGGQPLKGQSLLKQEENYLICFTSFSVVFFASRVRLRHSKITSTSSNIKQSKSA